MGERYGKCTDHHPITHGDNKPAWCDNCGLTAYGRVPWVLKKS